jgi:probable HAF family extracellular repeat protein
MTDLGILPGYRSSFGEAINNAGQVTGRSESSTGPSHAFLYTNGQMMDLNGVIDPALDVLLSGATA